jgi:prolyl-tRNA editing enzyme YbaK/EbsC (Cys-tRNA(Pro) deacylase)
MPLIDFARRHRIDPIPRDHHAAHLPPAVAAALQGVEAVVLPCPDEYSDTAAFSERFGFGLEDCANTLLLKVTRGPEERYAAVVTLGSRRLDINGAVKAKLEAKRLSFARREIATEVTGMQFGGITAFGLPASLRVLVDGAVMERPFVVMGAGFRETKILIEPSSLLRLPQVEVAAISFP